MPQLHRPTSSEDRAALADAGLIGESCEVFHVEHAPSTARLVTVAVTHRVGVHTFTEYRSVIRTHRNPNQGDSK